MKLFKYILSLFSVILLGTACSSDLDEYRFDQENATPSVLNDLSSSTYVLDAMNPKGTFETFEWNDSELGEKLPVSYVLQTDIAGKNFANPQTLTSGKVLTIDITVGAMNDIVQRLIKLYELEADQTCDLEFRVKASPSSDVNSNAAIYSNIISATITPYGDEIKYPKVHVMGGYSDWNWDNAQGLFDFNNSGIYKGWIYFNGRGVDGFKLAIQSAEGGWAENANWGLAEGQTVSAEANSIILISSGSSGNIGNVYAKPFYLFSFDTATATLTKLNQMNTLGIIGNGAKGWGDNDDIAMIFNTEKQVFTATITLNDGDIKFRADGGWDLNWGRSSDGILSQGGDNITVTAGTYTVTVNLNNPDNMTYKVEAVTP